ncbi:hypothetical protein CDV31_006901 [Fusarium ambrosium]|uniref:Uncharacterized protein n=1 Tax=Fusarium ambrosium TaxID=131363 RepID=A0A428U9Y5_9HYPO|nr:hypothetical protein CDV31_006901 [Fusarium ambrosium]
MQGMLGWQLRWIVGKGIRALEHPPPLQLLFALRCESHRIANARSSADSSPSFWVSAPTSRLPPPSRRQIRPLCAHRVTSFLAELTPVLSNATR